MANIISNPITGNEDITSVSSPYEALVHFYDAFNAQKIENMADNWIQSDEASMSNPLGGVKRGWSEILPVYQRIFNGSAHVYVEYYDYSIHETDDLFFAVGRERGTFKTNELKIDLEIRTSRIYQKVRASWKQIHHHGSIETPDMLKSYQTAVNTFHEK